MKKLVVALLLVVAGVVAWGVLRKNRPPEVNFARVRRLTLVSTLSTNGKVEPFEWQAVRAPIAGLVSKVEIKDGRPVQEGAVMAEVSDASLGADIQTAQAKVAEARANLASLEAGGKPAELTEIENSLAQARLQLQREQKEYDALSRLVEKQAATRQEADAAREKIRQTQLEIEGLQKRRGALVAKPDIAAASARLNDAETALRLARQRAALAVMRAPLAGVIYDLSARPGEYLQVGGLIANVGRVDRLHVRVYVDEPELGRVAEGNPVKITWDALPGKTWQGTVERKPTSIQALGSRQVGEVVCTIENPGRELAVGANVNAEIRTAQAADALVIPKEAVRRDAQGNYVLLLAADHVERRTVETGISSISQTQIARGLTDADSVAIPGDSPLKPGDRVTPVTR